MIEYLIKNRDDIDDIAKNISNTLSVGKIVLLNGDLGVGKTFLCRRIIQAITKNPDIHVSSPTFNIVKYYDTPNFRIYHYDLYRIKGEYELYEIGLDEAIKDGVCLIEWPEIANNFFNCGEIINVQFCLK